MASGVMHAEDAIIRENNYGRPSPLQNSSNLDENNIEQVYIMATLFHKPIVPANIMHSVYHL